MKTLLEDKLSHAALDIFNAEPDADTAHILKRNIIDSYAGICGSLYDTEMLRKFERMIDIAPVGDGVQMAAKL